MIAVRAMRDADGERVAEILVAAFSQVYRQRGHIPPFPNTESAIWLCRAYLDLDREGCAVAEVNGNLVGAGFVHVRGNAASIGPLAARPGGPRGVGRALMAYFATLTQGCSSVRLFQDSFNPDSFGLYTELGWVVRDVAPYLLAADIQPAPQISPGIRSLGPEELHRVEGFDRRMVDADRARDLRLLMSTGSLLVQERPRESAREREQEIEGFIFLRSLPARAIIGPAVAVSEAVLADLFDAACRVLDGRSAVMRASASTPAVLRRAFERGFRVDHLGNLMVFGNIQLPEAQLYALFPESL